MTTATERQTDAEIKREKQARIMDGVATWASFYRANPHRFARDYLGLRLKKFQQIILNEMFRKVNSIYLASRGGGKSFLLAIFCACYCILFPGTTICLASKTRGQATLLVNELVNLEYETKNNVIRVKEKSGMRKDRYSSLSYNIFVAKTIEREAAQSAKNNTEALVFNFRAPKISRNYRGGR